MGHIPIEVCRGYKPQQKLSKSVRGKYVIKWHFGINTTAKVWLAKHDEQVYYLEKSFFDKELVKPSIQSGIKQSVDITTIPRL